MLSPHLMVFSFHRTGLCWVFCWLGMYYAGLLPCSGLLCWSAMFSIGLLQLALVLFRIFGPLAGPYLTQLADLFFGLSLVVLWLVLFWSLVSAALMGLSGLPWSTLWSVGLWLLTGLFSELFLLWMVTGAYMYFSRAYLSFISATDQNRMYQFPITRILLRLQCKLSVISRLKW